MPFNLTLITFVSGTPALAGDVNTNFTTLNTGNMATIVSDNGKIFSDGSGALTLTSGHLYLPNNIGLRFLDSSGASHDVLYVDAANETVLQAASTAKVYISSSTAVALMSIDSSGNVRCRGTLTQNVTP